MHPLKLTMQAFGPYLEKQTLDFGQVPEEAPLLICSPGGSGKTELIDALFFALFGLAGFENRRSLNGLRNIEAGPETPTEVTLDFKGGERLYRVERFPGANIKDLDAGRPAYEVTLKTFEDEKCIARGKDEVTLMIEKILEIENSDYINLVRYAPDGKNPVISCEEGVSKAFLERIFQADFLENIWPEILRQCNGLLQQISRDRLSFEVPAPGSAFFQADYYRLTLEDIVGFTKIEPQSLAAGNRAIIVAVLHLGIIKTLQLRKGPSYRYCLFLDRFLEQLDQASLKRFIRELQRQNLRGIRLIFTSSNPHHRPYFKVVSETMVDQTSRALIRIARLCREGLAMKHERIDPARQKRLDCEIVHVIGKYPGEPPAETSRADQEEAAREAWPPSPLRGLIPTLNTLLELTSYLRNNKIPFSAGCGRSSSSLALYALGITELDPLPFNLSADNFFFPLYRGSYLRIWFVLPDKYQDRVFEYAANKYGQDTAELLFLGLDCLAMWFFSEALLKIQEITAAVELNRGERLDLSRIPLDDRETFALLSAGETRGIYALAEIRDPNAEFDRALIEQYPDYLIESDTISKTLQEYKPATFGELMLIVALFNLGALCLQREEILPKILNHKRMSTSVQHDLPVLQKTLEETYGLLVYREQLLDIIITTSRFNMIEAEQFFRLLLSGCTVNKRREAFQANTEYFIKQGLANGYSEEQLNTVLKLIYKGAEKLTFKANAANHTLITYRMAYLKAHYREEYETIMMNS